MTRGPVRRTAAAFAGVVFAVLVIYLFAESDPHPVISILLVVTFALLALRASGLRRADFEVDAQGGHYKLKTEFEGPDEDPADDERDGG